MFNRYMASLCSSEKLSITLANVASSGTDFTNQMLPQDSTMRIDTHREARGGLLITQQPMPLHMFKQCACPILSFFCQRDYESQRGRGTRDKEFNCCDLTHLPLRAIRHSAAVPAKFSGL